MHTIFCFTDVDDDTLDFSAEHSGSIPCQWMAEQGPSGTCYSPGEVYSGSVQDFISYLMMQLQPRNRYRIACSHARVILSKLREEVSNSSGFLSYRTIETEFISLADGNVSKVPGVLVVDGDGPQLAAITIHNGDTELTVCDIGNYGVPWRTHCQRVAGNGLIADDERLWECTLMPGYAADGLELLFAIYDHFRKVCLRDKLGRPTLTYSGQGNAAYYVRGGSMPIRQTKSRTALNLELGAYFGGRLHVNGYGNYKGYVAMWDVSAFYPFLATKCRVPFDFVSWHSGDDADYLRGKLDHYYCIAKATVLGGNAYAPMRCGLTVRYPNRDYETCLHDCELRHMLAVGRIIKIHEIACYRADTILKPCAEYLLSCRAAREKTGDKLGAHFVKCVSNGWLGRMGSKFAAWEDVDNVIPPASDCTWTESVLGSGSYRYLRAIGNRVQRRRDDLLPWNGSMAIAGSITAYGRDYLYALMQYLGVKNVLYASTDAVVVSFEGDRRLSFLDTKGKWEAGRIRRIEAADCAVIAGQGLYEIGQRNARQGFSAHESTNDSMAGFAGKPRKADGADGTEGGYDPANSPLQGSYSAVMERARQNEWKWY